MLWFWIWMALVFGNLEAAWELILEDQGLSVIETPAEEVLVGLAAV